MDSWTVKVFTSDQNLSTAVAFGIPQLCSLQNDQLNFENQIFGDISFPPLMNNSLFNHEDHESKSGESGRIDLNFGRITDRKHVCIASRRSEQKGGVCSLASFCKVYGCNKNLSSCKEYYKRHKVCEVHSKTSKVIVNGVEQRFCQQCSRFHLLREFDDGKRSCRKRLAGHNERRRKPHVGPFFERHGRLLPSYTISVGGNEFKESAGAISSFTNPNGLHSPYQQIQENNVRWDMNLQSSTAITDKQLHSTSVTPCNFETNPRFINGSVSSSESARSLLSSRSGSTSSYSSRTQTPNSKAHPVFLGSHDLKNPMVGFEDNLVKYGFMYYDDQVVRDESCMIDLVRLSSQLDRVEHQKRNAQVNPAN